jgi:hypothetical protein
MTALHYASRNGKLETVRTLVELGVEKEAKDEVRNLIIMMVKMNFIISSLAIIIISS